MAGNKLGLAWSSMKSISLGNLKNSSQVKRRKKEGKEKAFLLVRV